MNASFTRKESMDKYIEMFKKDELRQEELMIILSAYIIDRCDNMFANTTGLKTIQRLIHEMSLLAYKLYLYSKVKHLISIRDDWGSLATCYVDLEALLEEIKEIGVVKGSSLKEILEIIANKLGSVVRKNLSCELKDRLVELLERTMISSPEELREYLGVIEEGLRKGLFRLLIVPADYESPLFFLEYYMFPRLNINKVKLVLQGLRGQLHEIRELIRDDKVRSYVDKLIELGRKIEERLTYVDKLKARLEGLKVKVYKHGCQIQFEIIRESDGKEEKLRVSVDWESFLNSLLEFASRVCEESKMAVIKDCLWRRIYRDIYQQKVVEKVYDAADLLVECLAECTLEPYR